MRPIYNNISTQNNGLDMKAKSMNKNSEAQKEFVDKTTSITPQRHSNESFYLTQPFKAGEKGIQSSTLIETDPNNNTINTLVDQNSVNYSAFSSNIDTTPLFSPSQIMKLNRQRIARESISEDMPELSYYQKYSNTRKYIQKCNDLNNNKGMRY